MAKNFGRVNVSITASTGGLTAGLAAAGNGSPAIGASAVIETQIANCRL
jgi:hypothetical protein